METSFYYFLPAFILALIAGLATGLGGCLILFVKNNNFKYLAFSLGLAAGVMIYISLVEILKEGTFYLSLAKGAKAGGFLVLIGFFSGIVLIYLINKLIPETVILSKNNNFKLMRTGLFLTLVIAIHNFPEGIISFFTTLHSLALGIPVVIAIALHNIPEGIAVAMPIYYATNNKGKALCYSLLAGMAEPLGALMGYLFLWPFLNEIILGMLYATMAGIMVFISFNELLPTAKSYGPHSLIISGLMLGMGLMAISLWLFI